MAQEKTAVVVSGGGMKCAYGAGALVALGEKLHFTTPDILVAASGGVGNSFYYLTGQCDAARKAWSRYLPSPEFISYFPFPTIRVNYLVDDVFKRLLPLDTDALAKSRTRYCFPVTDFDTGKTRFVTNETWLDPLEVARAAMAVPIAYGKYIRLGNRRYIDGDFGTDPEDLVREAARLGATRILLITNEQSTAPAMRRLFRAYSYTKNKPLRETIQRDTHRSAALHAPDGTQLVAIEPTYPLPVGSMTRNPRLVMEAFAMGEDDLIAKRAEIEHLFTT